MPVWDTTLRLSKRLAGAFLLFMFVIGAGTQAETPARPASLALRAALAQASGNSQDSAGQSGDLVIRTDVDEVLLHASVIDNRQHIVTDLDKSAFTVFEDGKPQTIIHFRHEDIPVSMAIVIDNSGSMREKRNKVNQAALNLVRSSNPRDQVCVVNFN